MVKNRKNKKAWLRIVEATLSVIIILSAVLIFYQTKHTKQSDNFSENLPALMDEVAKNPSLRGKILKTDLDGGNSVSDTQNEVVSFLSYKITRPDLNYNFIICKADASCTLPKISGSTGDVYAYERIISTNLSSDYNQPAAMRKVKLYIWKIR